MDKRKAERFATLAKQTAFYGEASAFLVERLLLAPLRSRPDVRGLVHKHFYRGWRARGHHERKEAHL